MMQAFAVDGIVVAAFLVFVLSGIIKGTVGMGLPITAIGILSQFTDPRLAITLAVFPIVFSNAWQLYRAGDATGAIRRYAPFAIVMVGILFLAAISVAIIPSDVLVIALGLVIVLFSVISLTFNPPPLPDRLDRPAQIVSGVLAGILGGLTAIWSPPVVVYLLARRIGKDEFVRASGALFFVGSVPLLAGYMVNGQLAGAAGWFSAFMIVPTLIGFSIGEIIRRRLDGNQFRTAVLVMFVLMGLNLLRRAIF